MRRGCGGVCVVPYPTPSAAQQRTRFDPRPVCVEFVVEKGALGQVLLRTLRSSRPYHSTNAPCSVTSYRPYVTLALVNALMNLRFP